MEKNVASFDSGGSRPVGIAKLELRDILPREPADAFNIDPFIEHAVAAERGSRR